MKTFYQKNGPYIKDKNKTSNIMNLLLLSLLPIILFSEFKNGILPYLENKTDIFGMLYPLFMILSSGLVTYLTEYIGSKFILNKKGIDHKKYMKDSYSIIPGIFLALILPLNTPISLVYLGGIIAILIGKIFYGGFGHNIFNPALIGCLFILSSYSLVITENGGYLNSLEVDTISKATPLSNITESIGTYETLIEPYGNLWNFFIGTIPGAVGETSALLCLLALLFLSYKKVIKTIIPCIYIGTVFILTSIIGLYNDLGLWYPLFQIFSGGLFFGAVFMATDPVTSPTTKIGQILYALGLGILTVTFRYLTPYPEGVLTSILIMNMFVFICDKIGNKANRNKKYLISILILIVIGLSITTTKALNYKNGETQNQNFKIIEKTITENKINYIVTQKGYGGNIKANITITNGTITKLEIIEHNESFYQKIEDNNYINKLLQKQDQEIDTVSGATITSKALKEMVKNVKEDYQNNNKEIGGTNHEK